GQGGKPVDRALLEAGSLRAVVQKQDATRYHLQRPDAEHVQRRSGDPRREAHRVDSARSLTRRRAPRRREVIHHYDRDAELLLDLLQLAEQPFPVCFVHLDVPLRGRIPAVEKGLGRQPRRQASHVVEDLEPAGEEWLYLGMAPVDASDDAGEGRGGGTARLRAGKDGQVAVERGEEERPISVLPQRFGAIE